MNVLHIHWIPTQTEDFVQPGKFYLWVETDPVPGRKSPGLHPSHLRKEALAEFLQINFSIKADGFNRKLAESMVRQSIFLPALNEKPLPSLELLSRSADEDAGEPGNLASWQIDSYPLDAPIRSVREIHFLASYQSDEIVLGRDFLFWSYFTQSLRQVILKDQYIPVLLYRDTKSRAQPKRYEFYPAWQIQSERYEKLIRDAVGWIPPACANGFDKESLLRHCGEVLIGESLRALNKKLPASFIKQVKDSALEVFCSESGIKPSSGSGLEAVRQWHGWRQKLTGKQDEAGFHLCFQLNEATPDHADSWSLQFQVTSRKDLSYKVDLADYWRMNHTERSRIENQLGPDFEKHLLLLFGSAARSYPSLWSGLECEQPTGLPLTLNEAFDFLKESAWILEDAGFRVIVPAWWTPQGRRRAKIRLRSAGGSRGTVQGPGTAGLSIQALLDYRYELSIGNEPINREEWSQLVEAKTSLVHFRGQWMELDRDKMQAMLTFWQEHGEEGGRISIADLVKKLAEENDTFEVDPEDSLNGMLSKLNDPSRMEVVENPKQLRAELRDYQKRGVSWLLFLENLGLNGCLADDMGLGKTVQVIARLSVEKSEGKSDTPTLLIAPTSVIGNWQKEIERFAPYLNSLIHHGSGREQDPEAFQQHCSAQDMVITSYPLIRMDAKLFNLIEWQRIVLDEAQNIKNPKADQTRAILRLKAKHRLALTGTPVENRLLDLWSIFNFLNPGYLGNPSQFRKNFEIPIQRDHAPLPSITLKKLVEPFILRRLKTDRNIIRDLPDKVENKQYCNLTKEQASLYEAVVDDVAKRLDASEGIERQGLMLSTLMKLKQICNHPMQFLQDGSAFTPKRSHKLERVIEMLEEVISEGDSVLVFTQFTEIGENLTNLLKRVHRWNSYYLHGGTSRSKRERMIAEFQSPDTEASIFILSVKAGGVGITLTKGNHVFHFDRWWNPAVEDQATDRAFRIGQQKNVFVHKFVTLGTIEERIDKMIEDKKTIAQSIVGNDESWLTRLDNDTFKQLIKLNKQNVVD